MNQYMNQTKVQTENHAKQVLRWRETLALLPDNQLLEMIRIYLGEIKTPYTKEKLIENLSSFIHKNTTQEQILKLLTQEDITLISAIHFIEEPTESLLNDFFQGSALLLNEKLLNLQERLLIFCYTTDSDKKIWMLNPLLQQNLEKMISIKYLLPSQEEIQENHNTNKKITPLLLASFYSYIANHSTLCKQDGKFKKKNEEEILEFFSGIKQEEINNPQYKDFIKTEIDFFTTLLNSLINLDLFQKKEKYITPKYHNWIQFAKLNPENQNLLLIAAACGKDSKNNLKKKSIQAFQLLNSIPETGFSQKNLGKAEFLVKHGKKDNSIKNTSQLSFINKGSRFAEILAKAQAKSQEQAQNQASETSSEQDENKINNEETFFSHTVINTENLTGAAIKLGFLQPIKTTEETIYVFSKNTTNTDLQSQSKKGLINIDAAFVVTILPGLTLSQLLPIIVCLDFIRFDTAVTFEITKKSIRKAFDLGFDVATIISNFDSYLMYSIPENLQMELEDWFLIYDSVAIYHGYVLNIKTGKNPFNNPILAPHIVKELSPSIFIMDFQDDFEAQEILKSSGFENSSNVKVTKRKNDFSTALFDNSFFLKNKTENIIAIRQKPEINIVAEIEQKNFLTELENNLKKQNLEKYQYEGLLTRIQRKTVLSEQQLNGNTVKSENLEVIGMNFPGKIRLVEQAISTKSLLELKYIDNEKGKKTETIGLPIKIEQYNDDAFVILKNTSNDRIDLKQYSIGQAFSIRRIKSSIFNE